MRYLLAVLLLFGFSVHADLARAEVGAELVVDTAPDLSAFRDRPLDAVVAETLGTLWPERVEVRSVRPGERVSAELVRRGLRELAETGRYADLRAELLETDGRIILAIWVRPRRLIAQVRLEGSKLPEGEAIRALGLVSEDEITEQILADAQERVRVAHERAGFLSARVSVVPQDTDDARRVLVRVRVDAGDQQRVSVRRILVSPATYHSELTPVLERLRIDVGDRQDEARFEKALEALIEDLIAHGFYEAKASFRITSPGVVEIRVEPGLLFRVRIEGNQTFGSDELEAELDLAKLREPKPDLLEPLLRKFYVRQGFLDARVRFLRMDSKNGLESELYGWVREGARFQVERRLYPCLGGSREEADLDDEVDAVLGEQFPAVPLVEPPASTSLDAALSGRPASNGPTPLPAQPWQSYSDAAYQAARTHLENLLRSEGYLDAQVGPVTLARRTCARDSPPGECRASGPLPLPVIDCSALPPGDARSEIHQTCVPDPARGVRCEATGVLVMPIVPGRQAVLYDVRIEGNAHFTESELFAASELELGQPLSRSAVEAALRTLRDLYAEDAYAFAQIDSELELSPDHTRARLLLSITEREPVRVSRIDVRGADKTREGLIRGRLTLAAGDPYKKSVVERSQLFVETLGAFTSVSIGLQDPGIPARDKVAVVTVSERPSQYLDIKGGFSTGEGFRIGFEYGHRNLGGEAIQLTVRSQLGIRPPALIFEADVRAKYEKLSGKELLERRNTITLAFPETGLGPLFRFEVEGLDAHTNQRDFSQTRDAGILRLIFRPDRPFLYQLGATVEWNVADIFSVPNVANVVRVPQGESVAITQNFTASWDRRDRALGAHRGTFLSGTVEHVTAVPLGVQNQTCEQLVSNDALQPADTPQASCSEFLRYSGRVAGYVPITKKGMTWAISLRSGVIQHLTDFSQTYPDRLFFMGGVDSIRAYPQDSLVPQDLAEKVLDGSLSIQQIALRGGDFFFNPRTELRIPLVGSVQTVVFFDAGNLWADETRFDLLQLRYAIGTGLRIDTPVGPLVFDYGFNVDRVLDAIDPSRPNQRTWEQLGAFHFSIGLF